MRLKSLAVLVLIMASGITERWCASCSNALAKYECGGCGVHAYCSKECQRCHWFSWGHRVGCQRLATATAVVVDGPPWCRYKGTLTDEDIAIERRLNADMERFVDEFEERRLHVGLFATHEWLLDEWNKNSKLLLNALVLGDEARYKELMLHRLGLNVRLDLVWEGGY